MNNIQPSLKLPKMDTVWQETLNWLPDEKCQAQFQHLYEEILEGNRQFNLTRITTPEEFWEKHLWDSLRGVVPQLPSLATSQQVIDIGTGAGFPGLPVAIAFPQYSGYLTRFYSQENQLSDQFNTQVGS